MGRKPVAERKWQGSGRVGKTSNQVTAWKSVELLSVSNLFYEIDVMLYGKWQVSCWGSLFTSDRTLKVIIKKGE
jgi:hypothetical protein